MAPARLLASVTALAASLAALPVLAADANKAFQPKGIGVEECKDLIEVLKKNDERGVQITASWLDGYITAVNTFINDTYDVAPWQDEGVLLNMIGQHCEKNPSDRLAVVAPKLVEFLMKDRLAARAEVVEAKAGDRTVRVAAPVLKRAQEQLVKQGFLKGTPDGSFGPKTKTAFEGYQAKNGLTKTGVPDKETLWRLLLAPAAS